MSRQTITLAGLQEELGPGANADAVFDAVCIAGGYGEVGNHHHGGTVLDFESLGAEHKAAVEKAISDAKPKAKKGE